MIMLAVMLDHHDRYVHECCDHHIPCNSFHYNHCNDKESVGLIVDILAKELTGSWYQYLHIDGLHTLPRAHYLGVKHTYL